MACVVLTMRPGNLVGTRSLKRLVGTGELLLGTNIWKCIAVVSESKEESRVKKKTALSSRARNLGMETINNFAFLFLLSEDRGVETSESEKKWRHTSPDQLYNFTSLSLQFTSYKKYLN